MMYTELYRIPEPNKDCYSITGGNEKGLIICASASDLTDSSKVFLSKILAAIEYDLMVDCLVISLLPNSEVSLSRLIKGEKASDLFIFGLNPADLGFNVQVSPYSVKKMENIRLLWSNSLADLQSDKSKKVKLWQSLQHLFLNI